MAQTNKIQIEFDIPEHGWLLTKLIHREFKLELDISDVPLDPMAQLCDSLIEINKGIKEPSRVIWHLEPFCYYLQLKMTDNGYTAIILESNQFDSPTKTTIEISGTFDEIILPFYRALKKFGANSFKPPHWNELDPERIKQLSDLIKKNKKHNEM